MGGTLLLGASHQFEEQYCFRRDFLLVSSLNDSTPLDSHKAPGALGILAVMVLLSASGVLSILEAAFIAASGMILSGCLTASRAPRPRSVDLPVLGVIASSFALGNALTETGAAQWVAGGLMGVGPFAPWLAVSKALGVNFTPFAVAVMLAASASLITPLGLPSLSRST